MPARPPARLGADPNDIDPRLKDIVATVGDWIWETNENLELTFASDRFSDTTGLPISALLGRTLPDVALAHDRHHSKEAPLPAASFTLAHQKPFKNIACSLRTDQFYMSAELRALSGYKNTSIKSESWLSRIHPDDRPAYRALLIQHLKGQTPSFEVECRLCPKNNKELRVRMSGTALRTPSGHV